MKIKLIWILSMSLFALFSWGASTVYGWKTSARENALRVDSLAAFQDSTRVVWQDSLRVVERRVVQAPPEPDELDERLKVTTRAKVGVGVQVAPVDTVFLTPVTVDPEGDVRLAVVHTYIAPYTIDARVAVPAPPNDASWGFRIVTDPIPLAVRLSCSDDADGDIIPALVQVEGPTWAQFQLRDLQQEPGICNPVLFALPGAASFRDRFGSPVLLGAGVVLAFKLLGVL